MIVSGKIGAGRTRVGNHDRIGIEGASQLRNHALRFDRPLGRLGERLELCEFLLFRELNPRCVERPVRACQTFIQHSQTELGIADQWHGHRIIRAGHRRVDVEMNYFIFSRYRVAPALGGYRAGTAADKEHHVGLVDQRASFRRAAVGADNADGQRVVFADRTFAADRRGHRRRQPLGELDQFALGFGQHHAAAADENRTGRVAQHGGGALDEITIGRDALRRITAKACIAPDFGFIDRTVLHIEGQGDMRGAGPAGGDLSKRGAKNSRQILSAVEHGVPLRHRAHERALIQLGERVTAARGDGNVGVDA